MRVASDQIHSQLSQQRNLRTILHLLRKRRHLRPLRTLKVQRHHHHLLLLLLLRQRLPIQMVKVLHLQPRLQILHQVTRLPLALLDRRLRVKVPLAAVIQLAKLLVMQ